MREAGAAKQAHILLVTHAQAGLDLISEAKQTLQSLGDVHERGLVVWRDALKERYPLNGRSSPPTQAEIAALDRTIEEQELHYALAF